MSSFAHIHKGTIHINIVLWIMNKICQFSIIMIFCVNCDRLFSLLLGIIFVSLILKDYDTVDNEYTEYTEYADCFHEFTWMKSKLYSDPNNDR